VDRLISIELWLKLQGRLHILQEAARRQLGKPMTYAAAEKLKENVGERDAVILGTGFIVRPDMVCETDGLVGAAALARAMKIAFNAIPIVVTERENVGVVSATCRGMGLKVERDVESASSRRFAVYVMDFPKEDDIAREEAVRLLKQYEPSAVISIERPGKNIKGVHHSFRGEDISCTTAKFDYLFESASEEGILTIGIGDVGNELGMGNIREAVIQHVPYAKKCLCPCKGGTACAIPSEVPVVAAVSNWGGYGIAAVLAALTEKFEVLHGGVLERRTIRECVDAGAVDGETGRAEPSVDGSKDELHVAIIELLHKIVKSGVNLQRKEHPIPTL